MATAKKTSSKSTAIVAWEAEMAAAAQEQAKTVRAGGSFRNISVRGGIMSIDDTPVKGNELRCVVLAHVRTNMWYDTAYSPDTPQAPACYAFDMDGDEDTMAPHERSREAQASSCAECEMNVMGSAKNGRGKACSNVVRLALVTEDALESGEALEDAEVRGLKVPVTSVKNFAKFVHHVADEMQRPTWGVVCTISATPDAKTQFKVLFEFAELVNFNQELYEAMQSKVKACVADLSTPLPEIDPEAVQPRGKPAKQAGRGKPVSVPVKAAKQAGRKALR